MAFPNDIKKHRQEERAKMTLEERQVAALEDIADVLESIRTDFLGWSKADVTAKNRQSSIK